MPKNKGKGGKNRRRGKNDNDDDKRELVFKTDNQGTWTAPVCTCACQAAEWSIRRRPAAASLVIGRLCKEFVTVLDSCETELMSRKTSCDLSAVPEARAFALMITCFPYLMYGWFVGRLRFALPNGDGN
jgi:hypothetical protein